MSKHSSGTRKYGRNEVKCKAYRVARKHEKSHVRRIKAHLAKYGGGDKQAVEALKRYEAM